MLIVCPHCNFSKDIPNSAIPPGHDQVSCPKCKEMFPLPAGTDSKEGQSRSVPTPIAPTAFAGFWIRGAALFIDGMATGLIMLAAIVQFTAILLRSGINEQSMIAMQILIQLFLICLTLVYYVFFTGYCGQTPGKMAMRIKVVSVTGEEIGYGTALLRETLAKVISSIIFGIGYLMAAFDDRKQGLHDKIAKTVVVRI